MSTAYRAVGVVLVLAAVGGAVWFRTTRSNAQASVASVSTEVCEECALPPAMAGSGEPTPDIPTGSGLPCLAEFGSDECPDCQEMAATLRALEPKVAGRLDIVRVDTDEFPRAPQEWKLRLIPTQVAVSAEGEELWRHEGAIGEDDLLAELEAAGVSLISTEPADPKS